MIDSPFASSKPRLAVAVLVAAALLSSCAAPSAPPRPRLVVLLIVDGLPMRQVTDYRRLLAPDGLARFLDRGAWFAEAHYGHANTLTGPGHATVLTGAYPHRTGIIANEWRDPATGEPVYCTGDTTATYIGHATQTLDGTSPRNLLAETVGDVLRRQSPASKVIAISGKDRGAILPAGQAGTAYMYMAQSGGFASTTYYMAAHPGWVDAFNAAKPADRYFKAQWQPLRADADYLPSVTEDQRWFASHPGRLPISFGAAASSPDTAFHADLLRSPFVDEMSLAFARAAIDGEGLGRDDAPDILSISLSGHDYVNHTWSAESRLSQDHLLQLDRQFQAFFRHLDDQVGKGNYVAVLTADHGFMPAPEYSRGLGLDAGRVDLRTAVSRANGELEKRFGAPNLLAFTSASSLVMNRKAIAERKLDADAVAAAARDAWLREPAVAAAYTRAELRDGARAGQPFFGAMANAWHAERSGDVQFVLKPNWMSSTATSGTTHGSPHRYDTQVPILFYGPSWMGAGRVDERVEVADIAPTLARLLGVPVPSSSQGRALPLPSPSLSILPVR